MAYYGYYLLKVHCAAITFGRSKDYISGMRVLATVFLSLEGEYLTVIFNGAFELPVSGVTTSSSKGSVTRPKKQFANNTRYFNVNF